MIIFCLTNAGTNDLPIAKHQSGTPETFQPPASRIDTYKINDKKRTTDQSSIQEPRFSSTRALTTDNSSITSWAEGGVRGELGFEEESS